MKLEDLQNELEQDMQINPLSLQSEAAQIPVLWSKWLRYNSTAKKKLIQLDAKKKALVKDRFLYYTGRSDDQICPIVFEKSEVKTVLNGDALIIECDRLIEYFTIIADFTSKSLDICKNKGYSIKNMIEIRSLESGK